MISTLYRAIFGSLFVVLLGVTAPLQAFAATNDDPECLLGVVTKTAGSVFTEGTVESMVGAPVYIIWVSTTGSVATDSNGKVLTPSGVHYVMPLETTTYTYSFDNGEGTTKCSVVVSVPGAPIVGPTTIRVATIPLLSGGSVAAYGSVPLTYLQIANLGKNVAELTGFTVTQTGTADDALISKLTVINDKGAIIGSLEASAGDSVFEDKETRMGAALRIAPGAVQVVTIRALIGETVSRDIGTRISLGVTAVESNEVIEVKGLFPIYGVSWTVK